MWRCTAMLRRAAGGMQACGSRTLGARRRAGTITVLANGSWSMEFQVSDDVLVAEYDLPSKLDPSKAVGDFFDPLSERVRSGPTPHFDLASTESLRRAACTLKLFDDLRSHGEKLVAEERAMEAIALITSNWVILGGAELPLMTITAQRSWRDRAPAAGSGMAEQGVDQWGVCRWPALVFLFLFD